MRDTIGRFDRIGLYVVDRNCLEPVVQIGLEPGEDGIVYSDVYTRRVRRMMWSILSKAAERSKSVRSETCPESEASSESFTM